MSEDEAMTRWCPFVRNPYPRNEHSVGVANPTSCIGSACMAWRWSHERTIKEKPYLGFCGLAGAPQ